MHAVVDAPEARQPLPHHAHGPLARSEGVEHPYGDVGVFCERREPGVLCTRVHVVDEQPDLHAAIRRLEQPLREVGAGEVAVPDVGLHVQAAACELRAACADHERLGSLVQQPEGGLARVAGLCRSNEAIDLAALAGGDRGLDRQIGPRLELGAGGEPGQDERRQAAAQSAHVGASALTLSVVWRGRPRCWRACRASPACARRTQPR